MFNIEKTWVLVFHFKNGGYLAITFSFVMKLFILPTERNNYFGSVSKYVLVVLYKPVCN